MKRKIEAVIGAHRFVQVFGRTESVELVKASLEVFFRSSGRKLLQCSESPANEPEGATWIEFEDNLFELVEGPSCPDLEAFVRWLLPGNWTIYSGPRRTSLIPLLEWNRLPSESEIHGFEVLIQAYHDLEFVSVVQRLGTQQSD